MTGETTARRATTAATAVMAEGEAAGDCSVQDQVTIRMPADGAYLSVLRTATAGLAARLDFTLDEIEDLRIAVSTFAAHPRPPARDTFAWTVLAALAGSVDAWVGPGDRVTVMLRKIRESSRPG